LRDGYTVDGTQVAAWASMISCATGKATHHALQRGNPAFVLLTQFRERSPYPLNLLPSDLDSRTIFKPGMGQRVPAHFVRRICVAFRRVATRAAMEHQLKRRIVSSSKESSANEVS
jgi:hypothetical protein